jgi:hypothetical protein
MVESLKQRLVAILKDSILVKEDDGSTPVPGVVSAAWYDKAIFATVGWQVTVGPVVDAVARVQDLGAFHKEYEEAVSVSVWVLEKRGVNYTPERLRGDLVDQVDVILLSGINSPGGAFDHVNVSGWVDRDEPENGILRSDLTVVGYYQKTRV